MVRSEADGFQKSSRRFAFYTILLGLLLGAAAIWGANKQALGLFHDDGIYAVVAKAIYQGDGYRIISLPESPPQTKYPFLYSYLLSWLWALNPNFPGNILLLKALNIVVLVGIFFLSVALYRRFFPAANVAALIFGVLVGTNPILFTFTDYVVSDLLFVLLALAALYSSYRPATTKVPILAVLGGMACLTRLAAAPLVFAGAVRTFLSRGWRGVLYFTAIVLLLIAPWFVWVLSHSAESPLTLFHYYNAYDFAAAGSQGIGEWFSRHRPIVLGNAHYLLDAFYLLYLLPLMPWLIPFVVVFTAIGSAGTLRREDAFAWAFFLSSIALLLLWPFHPGRYLAPLVPFIILLLFRGMAAGERWIGATGGEDSIMPIVSKLAWFPVLVLLVLNGVWLSSYLLIQDENTTRGGYGSRVPYSWRGFEESFAWIHQNTAADARLGTAYDPMYFLYTGRQAIRPALHRSATYFYPYGEAKPDVGSANEIKAELEKLRIDYLIVDPMDGYAEGKATIELLDEIIASYGGQAKHVFSSTDGKHRIYALRGE